MNQDTSDEKSVKGTKQSPDTYVAEPKTVVAKPNTVSVRVRQTHWGVEVDEEDLHTYMEGLKRYGKSHSEAFRERQNSIQALKDRLRLSKILLGQDHI